MYCTECGKEMSKEDEYCPYCGSKVDLLYKEKNFSDVKTIQDLQVNSLVKENNLSKDYKGWNWGAFLITPIWGGINNVYIAFLWFFPLFTLPMSIILGIKGNKWAWQNRIWDSEEEFVSTQRGITKASFVFIGLILLIIGIIAFIILVYPNLVAPLRRYDPNANNL
ncbi:MAG TPA: zinc ribbon domain-containing protein [Clostridiaceae bacterium]